MGEGDADPMAEMPERTGRVGDGIAENTGSERQARTAHHGQTGAETPMLIDQVVSSSA